MKNDKERYKDYKTEVVEFVDLQVSLGRRLGSVLKNLAVAKSSYFSWKNKLATEPCEVNSKKRRQFKLTPAEENMIVATKEQNLDKRHRQIQGLIQQSGYYISPSSVFKVLKKHGLVEEFERRESPWKKPRYEVAKRNSVWGTDWTKLKINHQTWHLLTLIDFFSRLIIDWQIVPEVNSSHVKAIYQAGLLKQGLTHSELKPRLRADRGAPNTSRTTREFVSALTSELPSYARVRRPTDNAITERFYGTIKQEEIYVVGSYPDLRSAEEEIGRYMVYYNEQRPHQALWNFTPRYVHERNNKSLVMAELEQLKFSSRSRRREYWALKDTADFQMKMISQIQAKLAGLNDTQKSSIWSTIEKA